jgi:hypothetical protein
MRSIHGQLLVTCCDVMWYCADATCVMCLLTAGLQPADSRKQVFWNPIHIVYYIESKVTAFVSQVMMACSRSSGIAPHTLNLSVQCRWMFSLTLKPFYPRWYKTVQPDWDPGEKEILLFRQRIQPRICPTPWISNECKNHSLLFSVWYIVNNQLFPTYSIRMKTNMELCWSVTDGENLRYSGTSLSRQWRVEWRFRVQTSPQKSEILAKSSPIHSSVENTSVTTY